MARKKRRFDLPETAADESKEKKIYQDAFQQSVGTKIEEAGRKLEGKGKNILYGAAALAVLAVVIAIFYIWNSRSDSAAATALGRAIEISQAPITDTPAPAGSTQRTFKTEKERAEAAIAEFQAVADKFGGDAEDKAKYFIAVNRVKIDRAAGIAELDALAKSNDEVGSLSKFALAQAKSADGKLDEAAAIYRDLLSSDDHVIAKETINVELAGILEKQDKKQEAADIYYNVAKAAAEAKDAEGKPVPMSPTARTAKEKLEQLDPERAKEIVEPAPESPFGP